MNFLFLFKFDNSKEKNAEVCKGDGMSYQYIEERRHLNTSDVALGSCFFLCILISSLTG